MIFSEVVSLLPFLGSENCPNLIAFVPLEYEISY